MVIGGFQQGGIDTDKLNGDCFERISTKSQNGRLKMDFNSSRAAD